MHPFMNRDFTCSCIITQEEKKKNKSMISSLLEHKCAEQNDIANHFILPNRPWTAEYNFFSTATSTTTTTTTTETPARRCYSPSSTTTTKKTTTNKNNNSKNKMSSSSSSNTTTSTRSTPSQTRHDSNIKDLHNFLTSLLVSSKTPSAQDTADLEGLISLMKEHKLFDPTYIPQLQNIQRIAAELPCLIPSSLDSNITNSNSNTDTDTNTNTNTKNDSNNSNGDKGTVTATATQTVAPIPDFEFSFSSDRQANFPPPPEKPLYTTDRPTYRRGGVYADEYEEMDNVEDTKYEEENVDPVEFEAIIQQRKILPLPKPRWKRKYSIPIGISSSSNNTVMTTRIDENNLQGGSLSKQSVLENTEQERIARSLGETNNSKLGLASPVVAVEPTASTLKKTQTQKIQKAAAATGLPSMEKHSKSDEENKKKKTTLNNSKGTKKSSVPVKSIKDDKYITTEQQQRAVSRSNTIVSRGKKNKSKAKKKESSSVTKTATTELPHTNDDSSNSNGKKNTKGKRQTDTITATKKGKKSQQQQLDQQSSQHRKTGKMDWL
ncbi:hypothetical protein BDA99DRAFT_495495, partial [Phascolomyces articulosus]